MSTNVLQMDLTSSVRFTEPTYLFQYQGVCFKLLRGNPPEESDAIITTIPSRDRDADRAAEKRAFAAAGEFVSALAWSIRLPMAVEPGGGMSLPGVVSVESARRVGRGWPPFFTKGNVYGYSISHIAAIETDEQRRALAIMREASSANKTILKFLLYWQVMDIPDWQAKKWVNAEWNAGRVHLHDWDRRVLDESLARKDSLGDYLEDDCRHAIAHLQRRQGKRLLELDNIEDIRRMRISAAIAEELAESYVRKKLRLSKTMTLVRGEDGFPVYVKDGDSAARRYQLAYPER
jgi:hypothetical protein